MNSKPDSGKSINTTFDIFKKCDNNRMGQLKLDFDGTYCPTTTVADTEFKCTHVEADHILIVSQVIDYSHISKNQNYKGIEEFSNVIRKLFLFTSPLIFCKSTVLYNNRSKRISE
ncbi:hypothetical protein RIR_jg22852.t2 [Rhizophagus irregularis DAOM 181602=DAOM 197198]|nr:hypothetical protein RIR_jg22852.t2 [Rhizophagus irregularis DAOM 181602=DAOM 197198]